MAEGNIEIQNEGLVGCPGSFWAYPEDSDTQVEVVISMKFFTS